MNKFKNEFKYIARKNVGSHNSIPVTLEFNNNPPVQSGEGWCFKTNGGRIIYHPNAYKKVGWSNMNYHHSTLEIIVGIGWAAKESVKQIGNIKPRTIKDIYKVYFSK